MNKILNAFLPLGVAITLISGLVYVVGQQIIRQSANNPQIQIVEDAAKLLSEGNAHLSWFTGANIDIDKSLQTFLAVYDYEGNLEVTKGFINGKIPKLPSGVLDYAKSNGENRLTWEPEKGTRIATVIEYFKGDSTTTTGYALAGRSLKEIEKEENDLGRGVALGWIGILIISFGAFYFSKKNE